MNAADDATIEELVVELVQKELAEEFIQLYQRFDEVDLLDDEGLD